MGARWRTVQDNGGRRMSNMSSPYLPGGGHQVGDGRMGDTPCLARQLADEFGPFDLDPAASHDNHKAPRYLTREDDGLAQPWCAPASG